MNWKKVLMVATNIVLKMVTVVVGIVLVLCVLEAAEGGAIIKMALYIVLLGLLVLCVFGRRWIPGVFYPKKEGMILKKVMYSALFGLLVLCTCGHSWVPGIFYPAKKFSFKATYEEPSPFYIYFNSGSTMNSFERQFVVKTLTSKKYDVLRIKEMMYKWESNTGKFLGKDKEVKFRLDMREVDKRDKWHKDERYNGWYTETWYLRFGGFNPEKLFKGKKIGDKFKFYLTVVYSFDDELENTKVLEYDVEVEKGKYTSPFLGWRWSNLFRRFP